MEAGTLPKNEEGSKKEDMLKIQNGLKIKTLNLEMTEQLQFQLKF